MDPKFEIIRYGMQGFSDKLNSFVSETRTSPVYANHFSEYYQEIQGNSECNTSTLVTQNGKPILGLIFSTSFERTDTQNEITYFGLPAAFAISETCDPESVNGALKMLLQSLNDSKIPVSRGQISHPRTIQFKPEALRSTKVEKLIFQESCVSLRFDRVLQLSQIKNTNKTEYSKSAREAIRKRFLNVSLTSNRDSEIIIHENFNKLKNLHFLSSGRKTRSEKSWELQLEMIKNGSAVLVNGKAGNEILSSALFMLNYNSSFYGISATSHEAKFIGASHEIIDFAVDNLPNFGIEEIWLGMQHSHALASTSDKQRSIEAFKGYFGGFIQTHLISKKVI